MEHTPQPNRDWAIYFIGTGEDEAMEGTLREALDSAMEKGRHLEGKRAGAFIRPLACDPAGDEENWMIFFLGTRENYITRATMLAVYEEATAGGRHVQGKRQGVVITPLIGWPKGEIDERSAKLMSRAGAAIRRALEGKGRQEITASLASAIEDLRTAKERLITTDFRARAEIIDELTRSIDPATLPAMRPAPVNGKRARGLSCLRQAAIMAGMCQR